MRVRTIGAALLATTLVVSNAFAASQSLAPLPAGKPAGVKEANISGPNGMLFLLGVGIVAAGIALTISGGSNDGVTTPTTTSTRTSGLP